MLKFKIATFNIFKDEGDFPNRISFIPDVLGDIDIIALQEDFESKEFSSSKMINKRFECNRISTKTRKKNRSGVVSSSNLTILSKYPINLLKELYFAKGKDEERACQICEINLGKKKIIFSNTHLCHLSSDRRKRHIKKILSKLKKYKADMYLFCGDLNATPDSREIQKLSEKFYSSNMESTYEDGSILDYIFIKSKDKYSVKSITLPCNLSDHYSLINKITLK